MFTFNKYVHQVIKVSDNILMINLKIEFKLRQVVPKEI